MTKEKLLTQKEACKLLRISRPTLLKYRKQSKLTYIKLQKKVLFRESDLLEFLRSYEKQSI